ncbi:MAG: 50S ribosomal protein L9 [Bacilli bacterium]
MKVLFVKDLKKQGKKGEIKEVKTGYAENYLIKNGYAVKLDEKNLNEYKEEVKETEKELALRKAENLQMKDKLEKVLLVFTVKTGDLDKVYGSISTKQVKDELDRQGLVINKNQVELEGPVASLGFHYINIVLQKDIIAKVKIHVIK